MNSKLHIQNQTRLHWSQQVELLFDGMRHRFFRTILTWTVVALAVAFVCYVIAEQKIVSAVDTQTISSLERFTSLHRFCAWIDRPIDGQTLQRRLALTPPDSWELDALEGLLAIHGQDAQTFVAHARIWTRSHAWFELMSLGNRRVIFNQTKWLDVIPLLADPKAFPSLKAAAYEVAVHIPKGLEQAAVTRTAYLQHLASHVLTLQKKQQLAKETIQELTLLQWLAQKDRSDAQIKTLFEQLGIQIPETRRHQLVLQAREYKNVLTYSLWQAASSRRSGGTAEVAQVSLTPAARLAAERIHTQQTKADIMHQRILKNYPGREEYDRTPWLVATAFLVCLAGISNAMLVSVLERFREIATMKCLGAMDSFIAILFLAEASIIGLIGGLAGGIIGVFSALLRASMALGSPALTAVDIQALATIVLVGVVSGWLLAMLSSIYPAVAAARMPPMAAMRME